VLNTPTTRVTKKTSIAVPAEVLLIIFKLVYHEELYSRVNDDISWPSKEYILSPSLFPYAIAAVRSYWRDVMALTPEFWSRVVVLVDHHAAPLPAVEFQLAWSRDLPLDVAVTRRMDTYTAEDKDESVRTKQVISRLLPHLHRFRNLTFDVMLSSSLPSFPNDFKVLHHFYSASSLNAWRTTEVLHIAMLRTR
jgi:hypothetical protein